MLIDSQWVQMLASAIVSVVVAEGTRGVVGRVRWARAAYSGDYLVLIRRSTCEIEALVFRCWQSGWRISGIMHRVGMVNVCTGAAVKVLAVSRSNDKYNIAGYSSDRKISIAVRSTVGIEDDIGVIQVVSDMKAETLSGYFACGGIPTQEASRCVFKRIGGKAKVFDTRGSLKKLVERFASPRSGVFEIEPYCQTEGLQSESRLAKAQEGEASRGDGDGQVLASWAEEALKSIREEVSVGERQGDRK